MAIRLTEEQFEELVEEALDSLPEQFQPYMENVVVEIRRRPTRRLLEDMDMPPDTTLLGVYQGVPLTEKSVTQTVDWPEKIYIFQQNIEAICHNRREVVQQVRTTVLHEVGHHFGMDEDMLDELGYG